MARLPYRHHCQFPTMMQLFLPFFFFFFLIVPSPIPVVRATTDPPDVSALNVMYNSMNHPSQLSGWSSSGGDPCGDSWKGIDCSGSSVTEIKLSGLGLSGSMGYQLSSLTSVTYFDLSNNNIQGDIPYQLPPNVQHLDLSQNSFTGGVPYSISQMTDLEYLSLAHNQLNGQLTDMFEKLHSLSMLDLSFNQFSGNLPHSFGSLSTLDTLYLQNNQFSGSIDVLAPLPLEDLNVQNNQFSGWIPNKLKKVKNLETDGNSWSSGPAPPGSTEEKNADGGSGGSNSGVNGPAIAGIVIGLLVLAMIILALVKKRSSALRFDHSYIDDQLSQNRSFTPLVSHELSHELNELKPTEPASSINMKAFENPPSLGLKPPPPLKSFNDNDFGSKFGSKSSTESATITVYSYQDLQAATGSFSSGRLLGEGSIGCAYKAKYADGKVLAVKKIHSEKIPGRSSQFMDIISGMSRLHHPNIAELVGYCSEPGHHLLVYEFQRNGSLYEYLHLSDDYSRPLTWDTRVRIALGTARAVEYLHDVCAPPSIHKNMKSANILLDAELNPRLSDCGLTDLYQNTSENLGQGYIAPECTKALDFTLKSDVYSFGVVMLELLSGRMPFDSSKPRSEQSLVRWATSQLHDIDALSQMVDPALRGLYPPKSLSRFADVIALCVQSEPEFRPPMSEVVQSLVCCVQRASMNKRRMAGDLLSSASRRSDRDESDAYY